MKKSTIILLLAGVALGIAAVIWIGAGQIRHAVTALGWGGLGLVVLCQLGLYGIMGTAWYLVCPGAPFWLTILGRLVREGGENCLPFTELGGLLFGARAVMLRGLPFAVAAGSSIVDVVAEGVSEIPFLLLGLVIVLAHGSKASILLPAVGEVVVLVAGGGAGFLFRHRLGRLLHWGAERIAKRWVEDAPDRADELRAKVGELFSDRRRFAGACLVHLVGWCGGGGIVWLTYHLLGARIGIFAALAVQSLLSGALSITFLIPGGLGVQEISYVAIGSLFGMPADVSLGLSLIRRARDIIIGAPALLVWQAMEARQLRSK